MRIRRLAWVPISLEGRLRDEHSSLSLSDNCFGGAGWGVRAPRWVWVTASLEGLGGAVAFLCKSGVPLVGVAGRTAPHITARGVRSACGAPSQVPAPDRQRAECAG